MRSEEKIRQRLNVLIGLVDSKNTLFEDKEWINQRIGELIWVLEDENLSN